MNNRYYSAGYQNNNAQSHGGYGSLPSETACKGKATASLVLGICSVAMILFGTTGFLATVFGVIGLITAKNAKANGYRGGIRTAGLVLSIIGTAIGGVAILGWLRLYACAYSALSAFAL